MIGLFLSIICFCIAYASWEISKTVELREVFSWGLLYLLFLELFFSSFISPQRKIKNVITDMRNEIPLPRIYSNK